MEPMQQNSSGDSPGSDGRVSNNLGPVPEARNTRRWRSPSVLVCAGLILLLLAGSAAYSLTHRQPAAKIAGSPISIVWHTSTGFDPQDKRAIESALRATAPAGGSAAQSQVDILSAERQGDWASFSVVGRKNARDPLPARTPGSFIAHREGGNWILFFPGSSQFCEQVKHAPETLLAPIDKKYFCP